MEQEVTLEVVDIANAQKVIEAALERGTFKAGELSGVAALYDKLTAFVKQQSEKQQVEPQQTQLEETELTKEGK